jgi:hypothetical protein
MRDSEMIILRALVVSIILIVTAGCSETFYEWYTSAHPGWRPGPLPFRSGDVQGTIASILAPRHYEDYTFVSRIRVFRVGQVEWSELDYDQVTSKSFERISTEHYLVVAVLSCQHGFHIHYGNNGVAWYLVLGDELLAYHHLAFRYQCEGDPERETNRPFPRSYLDCVDRIAALAATKREVASLARCGPPPDLTTDPLPAAAPGAAGARP